MDIITTIFLGGCIVGYAAGIWTMIIAAKIYSKKKGDNDDIDR